MIRVFPHGRRQWIRAGVLMGSITLLLVGLGACAMSMPGRSYRGPLPPLTPEQERIRDGLKTHVEKLAGEIGERNLYRYAALDQSAAYIQDSFEKLGYKVGAQEFQVSGKTVRNLDVELPGATLPREIVVIGAHYDSIEGCPGANDNATGVAGVLELARIAAELRPARTIRFVAFVNEEPPHFQTDAMGSLVYARRCRERRETIVAMLSLETIGYYSDAKGSQQYPFPFSLFYPDTGNFIGFVGNTGSRSFVRNVVRLFRERAQFPSEGAAPPGFVQGVGWSDHWAFWQCGYPGLMVTDTAPFRYPYYHDLRDTPDQIDYDRTTRVVAGLAEVMKELAGGATQDTATQDNAPEKK